ncbi:MAG TPA: extracellular solute-binding protein [Gemmatimonadales bacterium]|nr:extracellular solute-binding protein [Gemmatimonadales bacterium]
MKIKISLSLIVAILTLLAFLPAGRLAVLPSPAAAQELPTDPVTIDVWWWGETEAPGSEAWLDAAQKAYTELHPNVTFTNNLLALDALLPSYEAAGQAQEGPTIMYLWGGFYTMDAVWKGWIVPISDYVGMEEAEHYINKEEAIWDGKIWSAAWYLQPSYPIVYNKDAFTAAGLDPEAPPQTWDEFLAACDAFAAQDMPLVALGVKDTWGAGRFLLDSLAQQVTGVGEVLQAVTGETSFTDPKYVTFFERWQEMIDHDCFPDDVASLDMYTGQQLVSQGEAGLTFIAGSELASFVESIGADNTGLMKLPATGEGPFKDQLASTSQTLAVTSWASDDQKAVAADFIKFLHTPEQLAAYFEATGVPPADDRFDPEAIEDPLVRELFAWGTENPAPQFENFIPFDIWFNGFNTAQVQMITGQIASPADAAAFTQDVAEKWRQANRLLLEQYNQWAAQKAEAGG